MAKDVEIKIKVVNESGDIVEKTVKSMKDLETEVGKLKGALANAPLGSDKFKELNSAAQAADKTLTKTKESTMSLGDKIGSMGGPIGGAVNGFMGMTKAAIGFLATPIGAVVGALGLIFAAVTKAIKSNEEAMDALTKVTDMFSAIIQPVFDFLAAVAVKTLEAVAAGIAEVSSWFGLAAEEGGKLSETMDNIDDAEKDLAVTRAKTNAQLAESKEILSDTNATYEERKAALEKVKAAEEKQSKAELANAKAKVAAMKEQLVLQGQSEENIQALRDATIALANTEQAAAAQQRAFNKQDKALDKEKEAAAEEAQKEAEARAKEAAAKAKERRDAALAAQKDALKKEKDDKDAAYLIGVKDDATRAQEALRIQQENADADIQIKIKAYETKKKRTKDEEAALTALRAAANAQDVKQDAEKQKLLDDQAVAAAAKSKADAEKKAQEDKALLDKGYTDKIAALDTANKVEFTKLLESGLAKEEILRQQQANELQLLEQKAAAAAQVYGKDSQQAVDAYLAYTQKKVEADDAATKRLEENRQKELKAVIDGLNAAGEATAAIAGLSDAIYADKLSKVKKGSKEELALQKKAFDSNKKFAIAQALINGALAITAILSVPDFTFGILSAIRIGASIAATAASIIKINAAKFEGGGGGGDTGGGGGGAGGGGSAPPPPPPPSSNTYAGGGYVSGFGTSTSDSIPARLSNGESVINARSTAMFGGLLSAMNQMGGGKAFAQGGTAESGNVTSSAMAMPVIKTYVVASDMTSQQEADARIKQIARL
jgi:hypothetical protein